MSRPSVGLTITRDGSTSDVTIEGPDAYRVAITVLQSLDPTRSTGVSIDLTGDMGSERMAEARRIAAGGAL